jgi:hypothetical protein
LLLFLALLILILWLMGGFAFHVGGDLVHLLILVALVLICLHFWPRLRSGDE